MQGGDNLPRPHPPRLSQRVAYRLLALFGWRVDVHWPPEPHGVIIVYPHTSNWDFVVGIVTRYAMGLPVRWVGKDTLFNGPFGQLFKRWGGIPVNRRQSTGFIGQLQDAFAANPWLWVVITPEGTRSHSPHWKSGFYHLALAADVPVGLAYIDFGSPRSRAARLLPHDRRRRRRPRTHPRRVRGEGRPHARQRRRHPLPRRRRRAFASRPPGLNPRTPAVRPLE